MKRIILLAVLLAVALWSSGAMAAPLQVSPSDPGREDGMAAAAITPAAGAPLASPTATDIKNLNTGLTYATIADALADAATLDGHVLDVQVSPHPEGICTVSKAVTIQGGGGGGAIITSTTNTGTDGDARGWFLVTVAGVTFKDLTLDGSANLIAQALRFKEPGTVDHCNIQHIKRTAAEYNGVGIVGYKNLTVTDCAFTDIGRIGVFLFGAGVTAGVVSECTYTGKGSGDWLDYGIELGGGAVATLTNNTITGCTAIESGWSSAGVLITDYYAPGTTGTLTGNAVTGNVYGVAVGYDGTDLSTVTAHSNDLSGNTDLALYTVSGTKTVDASANWWGINTPAGVFGVLYGTVDYTPWFHNAGDVNLAPGFQGDFSTLWVDDDSPQTGGDTCIKEGISLVTASTVYLAPGNYPGNVIVNKVVTLAGSGDGANPALDTILLPPAGTIGIDFQAGGSSAINRVAVKDLRLVGTGNLLRTGITLAHVTLDNLTLTGSTTYAFEIHNTAVVTDLVMNDCDLVGNVTGMRVRGALDGLVVTGGHFDGNTYGLQSVTGAGEGNTFKNVSFTGTTFSNNTSKGMYFEKLSDAVFDGITANNSGTVGAWAAGIDINLKYTAYQNIEIKNSTVSGCGTGDPVNGVGLTVKARDDGGYAGVPATLNNVDITNVTLTGNQCGLRFGEPTKNNAGPTGVDVHQGQIVGSVGYGLDNQSQAIPDATCNWWGDILGPNVSPGNPSPGDDLSGLAVYAPWLDGPGGICDQYGANYVWADPTGLCLNPGDPCVAVPVLFTRGDTSPARGVSVTIQLSANLDLCDTNPLNLGANFHQGTWLAGYGSTFQVYSNGGGSYTIDQAILGAPCGVTTGGDLFTVDVMASGLALPDDVGTITVTGIMARDCNNAPLPGIPGPVGYLTIDTSVPAAITALTAAQDKTANGSDGLTNIDLSWTGGSEPDATIEIYRKEFGSYPEYDDTPGTGAPAVPSYPPAGWALVATLPGGTASYSDQPPARDFWYYVAFVLDECNVSAVSNRTNGTLDYHLGDVSDGTTPGAGDNIVDLPDISLLGGHYGITLVYNDTYNYLDVGPTTDYSVNARPSTDNKVQFEDLMMFAINYGTVSKPMPRLTAADRNALVMELSEGATEIHAVLSLASDGAVQGVSVPLRWNADVVEPVAFSAGTWAERQAGRTLVLSPEAGVIDAAVFGSTFSGEGELAVVTFRIKGPGDSGIGLGEVVARDGENRPVAIGTEVTGHDLPVTPVVTRLLPSAPNPFLGSTQIRFALAEPGEAAVRVYALDGRLVRTLLDASLPAGEKSLTWDGRDEMGRTVAAGTYIVRFQAPGATESQRVMRLR